MSPNTPLLPGGAKKKRDGHSHIFSRVCHSAWPYMGQKTLLYFRGAVVAYLLAAFFIVLGSEMHYLPNYQNDNGPIGNPDEPPASDPVESVGNSRWLIPFEFPNISLLIQIIYGVIAVTWTYSHAYFPDYRYDDSDSLKSKLRRFISPPKRSDKTKNHLWFSIFYTAATSYPLVASFLYWAILGPHDKTAVPEEDFWKFGSYSTFYIVHKYIVSAVLALTEVFWFSSLCRQSPIITHITGLGLMSIVYIGWAYLGYYLTGRLAYYYLDYKNLGWEYAATSSLLFIAIGIAAFAVVYFITAVREVLSKKAADKARES
ncbi:hypothetical protein BJ878DRAFT_524779 [Calycina marina]|uniref:Uncharacterized protein n=1 Tax=Calycina marina TaxID=1763456 RepID=A0A9P7YW01_9HELO|nr:hypothetical protein BJ878DRAFT_524779 [Calycina marina]